MVPFFVYAYCTISALAFVVEIGFNPTEYRVNEQERRVIFEIENRNPDRSGPYAIQFNTVTGSATESTNGGM